MKGQIWYVPDLDAPCGVREVWGRRVESKTGRSYVMGAAANHFFFGTEAEAAELARSWRDDRVKNLRAQADHLEAMKIGVADRDLY